MVETNGLANGHAYHKDRHAQEGGIPIVCWTTPNLEITRLRLLSDSGYPEWDVSYCHGILNGRHVSVALPFSSLPKKAWKTALYKEARSTGVFIKGLFSAVSTFC